MLNVLAVWFYEAHTLPEAFVTVVLPNVHRNEEEAFIYVFTYNSTLPRSNTFDSPFFQPKIIHNVPFSRK